MRANRLQPQSRRQLWRAIAFTLVACLLALPFAVPLVWMVLASLKPGTALFDPLGQQLTSPYLWGNYSQLVQEFPFWQDLRNTLIVAGGSMAGTLFSCSLTAYGLSHVRWRGREIVFFLVLATMMLPGWTTLIPLYVTFDQLHWLDTFLPLIVPNIFGASAFSIFLLRQFMLRLPVALTEAARLDGAGEGRVFWSIILPLCRPALLAVALLNFVGNWTDFFSPLIFLSNPANATLMLGLSVFQEAHATVYNLLLGASWLVTLPIIALFFFAQRYFLEGVQLTGLNG